MLIRNSDGDSQYNSSPQAVTSLSPELSFFVAVKVTSDCTSYKSFNLVHPDFGFHLKKIGSCFETALYIISEGDDEELAFCDEDAPYGSMSFDPADSFNEALTRLGTFVHRFCPVHIDKIMTGAERAFLTR